MIHLFRVWDRRAVRIRRAEHIILLFDFDETLSPIANRPAISRLSPFYRKMLHELSQDSQVAAKIISTRGLRDLQKRVGIRGLYYAGNPRPPGPTRGRPGRLPGDGNPVAEAGGDSGHRGKMVLEVRPAVKWDKGGARPGRGRGMLETFQTPRNCTGCLRSENRE